eukprot:15394504-Alexandrium_andersonii.AAC.1
MIVGKRAREATLVLHAIGRGPRTYALKLNKSKCACIAMNTRSKVKLSDGAVTKEVGNALSGQYLRERQLQDCRIEWRA